VKATLADTGSHTPAFVLSQNRNQITPHNVQLRGVKQHSETLYRAAESGQLVKKFFNCLSTFVIFYTPQLQLFWHQKLVGGIHSPSASLYNFFDICH